MQRHHPKTENSLYQNQSRRAYHKLWRTALEGTHFYHSIAIVYLCVRACVCPHFERVYRANVYKK